MTTLPVTTRRLAGVLRVAAFTGTIGLSLAALGLARARVRADELLLEAGAQMMFYARETHASAEQRLELNGQTIHFRVASSHDAADTVLDHFAQRCRQRDGTSHATRGLSDLLDGVLRTPSGPAGSVACLDIGNEKLDADGLARRLKAFVDSGDVARVGALRFAHARELGPGHTLLVTSWVDDGLPLARMFPERGDAPGVDIPGLPRPRGARRVLSARTDTDHTQLNSYRGDPGDPAVHALAYREELLQAGYTVSELPAESRERSLGFGALKDGVGVVVTIRTTPDGELETTTVSLP